MRLLYLVNAYPRLSHTFIRREIQALERLGNEVIRVSIRPLDDRLIDRFDVAEADRTHCLLKHGALGLVPDLFLLLLRNPIRFVGALARAIRLSTRSETGLLRHLAYFAEACAVTRLAWRTKAEHVHAHFSSNPPMVALLAERLGAPGYSFTVHGMEETEPARGFKLAEKVAAARFTVAISLYGQAQLQRISAPADHPRLHVVHCGLDPGFLENPSAPPNCHDLLFIGRLCPQKQPLLLIDAAARLAAEGVPFRLKIAGTGELRDLVAERIRTHGLDQQCHMLGSIDGAGVRRELDSCRALVLPSCAEGLPMVLMEALARQRPVITTFVAGIPELVRAGQEGWLVPVGDAEALAGAMKAALLASPAELARLGRSGAERTRQRHDAGESARRLADLFQRYRKSCPH